MIKAMEHVIELQSELDDAATDLGKALKPILKAAPQACNEEKPVIKNKIYYFVITYNKISAIMS